MKYKIFTAIFLCMCLLPSAGMFVLPPAEPAANERLSPAPKLFNENGGFNSRVLSEATDYVQDHFAFRQQLITLNSELNTGLLASSTDSNVIYGKGGWLYYAKTLDDYQNRPSLTESEIMDIAGTVKAMQEFCESKGAKFIFTIAPNKNSLYSHNMPERYLREDALNNYAMLAPALNEYGVNYADLFTFLRSQSETLYMQTDSHWSNRGAALAHDFLMSRLGLPYTAFGDADYKAEATHKGDLYAMLYPSGKRLEVQQHYKFSFSHVREPRSAEDIFIETENPGAENGRLLFFRDSFGNALYPFLAEDFQKASISRQMPYPLGGVRKGDTVIIEIVERNIPNLLKYPPDFGNT